MPLTTPFDVVADATAVQTLTAYAMAKEPDLPQTQTAILSSLGNLGSVPFDVHGSTPDRIGSNVVSITGTVTFRYPQDGQTHYDIYGVALTYEEDDFFVVRHVMLPKPVTLRFLGDFYQAEITLLVSRTGA